MFNDLITKEQIAELDSLLPAHSESILAMMDAVYTKGYTDSVKQCYKWLGIGCGITLGIIILEGLRDRYVSKKSITIKTD
ncbi:MAG: hypothetical protein LUD77_04355 [Clostridiales bacterium]|nr:hypothetical protein [Clostridiales bacterium]